jgi:hypothetical protein
MTRLKPPKYHLDEDGEMVRGAGDSAGEPVAWMYEYATTLNGDVYGGWTKDTSTCRPDIHERAIRNLSPLFAHPPMQTADVQAITPEWLWGELMDYCRDRGTSPGSMNRLFEIVTRARSLLEQKK